MHWQPAGLTVQHFGTAHELHHPKHQNEHGEANVNDQDDIRVGHMRNSVHGFHHGARLIAKEFDHDKQGQIQHEAEPHQVCVAQTPVMLRNPEENQEKDGRIDDVVKQGARILART